MSFSQPRRSKTVSTKPRNKPSMYKKNKTQTKKKTMKTMTKMTKMKELMELMTKRAKETSQSIPRVPLMSKPKRRK